MVQRAAIYLRSAMRFARLGLAGAVFFGSLSHAQNAPHGLNVSGGLFDASGAAIVLPSVGFKVEVLDQAGTCVLYSEQHLAQDLSHTKGAFSLSVGSGSSPSNKLEGTAAFTAKIFENNGATGAFTGCASGVTNASGDERLIRIYYDLGAGFIAMTPDVPIVSAPFALVAETLQGKNASDFAQINTGSAALSQANLENIFSNVNYPKLNALVNGSSTQYMVSSPSSAVGFNGQRITSVGTPTAATDAANKSYVDGNVGGKTVDVTGVGAGVGGGKTLVWDQALNKWVAQTPSAALSQIVAGTGLVSNTITTTGTLAVDVGTTANKIVQLNAQGKLPALDGFLLTNIAFPVTSVAGRTGAVTLNAADISGLGTAATQAYGTAANNLVQLNGSAQLPAVDGSLLTNVNATKLQSRSIAATAPVAGQVLTWNATTAVWEPRNAAVSGITDLTGDVSASGSGSVAATIANSAITSAKINASGYAINRILITDSVNPNLVTYANCSNGDVLRYGPTGWLCNSSVGGLSLLVSGTGLVAGSITTAGTLNVDVGTTAGKVLQVTAGGQYPALDGNLVSNINAVKIQSRNIASTAPAGGQVLGWNSSSAQWEPTSTAGVGTVTAIYAGTGLLGNTITASGTLSVDVGSTANKIVQLTAAAQYPGADGALIANINAVKLQSRSVASAAPAANQVLTWNNSTSQWEPQAAQAAANAFVQNGNAFGTTAQLGTTDITNLNFLTCNNTQITITSRGLVGIGTTAPISDLHLASGGLFAVTGTFGLGASLPSALAGNQNSMFYYPQKAAFRAGAIDDGNAEWADANVGQYSIALGQDVQANGVNSVALGQNTIASAPKSTAIGYYTTASGVFSTAMGYYTTASGSASTSIGHSTTASGLFSTAMGTLSVAKGNYAIAMGALTNSNAFEETVVGTYNTITGTENGSAWVPTDPLFEVGNGTSSVARSNALTVLKNGSIGIGTPTPFALLDVNGTGTFSSIILPRDTTANRSATPVNGMIRYNIDTSKFEAYEAGSWTNIIGAAANAFVQNGNAFGTTAKLGTTDITNLNLLTCNNTQMTITSQGYVGVGTTSPATQMHIYSGNSSNTVETRVQNPYSGPLAISLVSVYNDAGNSGGIEMTSSTFGVPYLANRTTVYGSNGLNLTASGTSSDLRFFTGGSLAAFQRMEITSSGSVGIGTTTPSAALDVNGTGTFSSIILPRDTTANRSPAPVNGMIRYNTNTSKFEAYEAGSWSNVIGSAGNAFVQNGNAFGTTATLGTTDVTNLNLITNNSTKLTITSAGNVGIGTASPGTTLDVNGTVRAPILLASTGSGSNISITPSTIINSGWGNSITLITTNLSGTANSSQLALNPNGSVGIGTTTPAAFLDVNGTGTFSGMLVPRDTTALRPAAVNGTIRYNTNTSKFEAYEAGAWTNIIGNAANAFVQNGNAFGTTASLGTTDVTNLNFLTCNNAQMTITSRGLVGIGTTAPGQKLSVAGTIESTVGGIKFPDGTTQASAAISAGIANTILSGVPDVIVCTASGSTYYWTVSSYDGTYVGYGGYMYYDATTKAFHSNVGYGTSDCVVNAWSITQLTSLGKTFNLVNGPVGQWLQSGVNAYYNAGNVGIGTSSPAAALDVTSVGTFSSIILPRDTTANRNATPVNGMIRYNTNTSKFEAYEAGAWSNVIGAGANSFVQNGNAFGATAQLGTTDVTNLNFLTCNNVQMTINSRGSVGIGTTAPSSLLHVAGQTAPSIVVAETSELFGSTASLLLRSAANTTGAYTKGAVIFENSGAGNGRGKLHLALNNAPDSSNVSVNYARLTVVDSGNVGIGTTNPSAALDITSTGTSSGLIVPRATTALRPAPVNGMIRYNTNTSKFEAYEAGSWSNVIGAGSNSFVQNGNAFGTTATMGTTDLTNLNFITNNTTNMTVTQGGWVGIGTTAPATQLEVRNNQNAETFIKVGNWNSNANADAGINLAADTVSGSLVTYGSLAGNTTLLSSTAYLDLQSGANSSLRFQTNSGTERMRINSAGQVGIGTVVPLNGAILDITGTGTGGSAIVIPRDSTANRTAAPVNGMLRYNTNTSKFEAYESGSWTNMIGAGANSFVQNGNAFGATAQLGTTDVTNLNFLTCNNTQMTITSRGSVGIGTQNPGSLLTVASGDISLTSGFYLNFTPTGGNTSIRRNNILGGLEFRSGAASNTVMLDNGTVGIGTTTPSASLDVNGSGTFSGLIVPRDATAVRPPGVNGMLRYNTNTAKFEFYENGAWVNHATSASGFMNGGNAFGSTASLGTTDVTNLNFLTCNNTQMTITSRGLVGIGTANPTSPLTLIDNGLGTTNAGLSVRSSSWLLGSLYDNGASNARFMLYQSGSPAIQLIATGNSYLNGGNVGIGTTSPNAILDINGTGTFSSIIVPRDTTANRNSAPVNGMLRYNTNTSKFEAYEAGAWTNVIGAGSNAFVQNGNAFGTTASLGTTDVTNLNFLTCNNTQVTITSRGLVGIGTTSPAQALDVVGAGRFSTSILVASATTANGYDVALSGDSTKYIGVVPNIGSTTTNGSDLVVTAGTRKAGGVDKNGGTLFLSGGISSGAGFSNIEFQTASPAASGASGNATTTKMILTGVGSLGLGTATPSAALDVNGTGTLSSIIVPRDTTANRNSAPVNGMLRYNTNTAKFEFYENGAWVNHATSASGFMNGGNAFGSTASLGTTDVTNLNFLTCNNTQMTITSRGNVGIGTASPSQPLQVAGNIFSSNGVFLNGWNNTPSYASAGDTNAGIGFIGTGPNTSPVLVYTSGIERMRVTNSGSVGIGTTSPNAILDINGTGTFSSIIVPRDTTANRNSAPVNGMLRYNTNTSKFEAYEAGAWSNIIGAAGNSFVQNGNAFGTTASLGTTDVTNLNFLTCNNTQMTITSRGNVGIGTTNPSHALSVLGTASDTIPIMAIGNNLDSRIRLENDTAVSTSNTASLDMAVMSSTQARTAVFMSASLTNTNDATRTSQLAFNLVNNGASSTLMGLNGAGTVSINSSNTPYLVVNNTSGGNFKAGLAFQKSGVSKYEMGADAGSTNTQNFFIWDNVASNFRFLIDPSGNVGLGTSSPNAALDVNGTGTFSSIIVPRDTTANRSATPVNGMIRYNTNTAKFEFYEAGGWVNHSTSATGFLNGGNAFGAAANLGTTDFTNLNLITNNSARLTILNSGYVGVGTSTPVLPLDVLGSANWGVMEVVGNGTNVESSIGFRSSNVSKGANAGQWLVGTNMSGLPVNGFSIYNGLFGAVVNVTSVGSVGIGTTFPNAILDVANSGTLSSIIVPRDTTANRNSAPVNGMLRYNTNTSKFEFYENGAWANYASSASGFMNGGNAFGSNASLGTTDVTNLSFLTCNNTQMTITSRGNVGIGTTAPGTNLQVSTSSAVNWNAPFQIFAPSMLAGNSVQMNIGQNSSSYGASSLAYTYNSTTPSASFASLGLVSNGQVLNVTGAGNVGIGTTSPGANLQVSGATPTMRLQDVSAGAGSLSRSMAGMELISAGMNTTSQYTPAVKFMSADADFTTENPKFLAGIVGRANESYTTDLLGAMSIDFLTTPGSPGANNVPLTRMTINHNGNVGVGTTSPAARLDIQQGQIRVGPYNAGTSVAIDWNNGNNQYTAPAGAACAAISFTNMLDGGSYTLAVQSVTSGTCTFSQSGLTFVYSPANTAVTADAVYTFLRMGSKVYVSWITGFQ